MSCMVVVIGRSWGWERGTRIWVVRRDVMSRLHGKSSRGASRAFFPLCLSVLQRRILHPLLPDNIKYFIYLSFFQDSNIPDDGLARSWRYLSIT